MKKYNNMNYITYSCDYFRKPVNKNAWSEEEQNELRNLFEEFKNTEGV